MQWWGQRRVDGVVGLGSGGMQLFGSTQPMIDTTIPLGPQPTFGLCSVADGMAKCNHTPSWCLVTNITDLPSIPKTAQDIKKTRQVAIHQDGRLITEPFSPPPENSVVMVRSS